MIFVRNSDPYGLTSKAGGREPRLFWHAEQIPGANTATVTALPCYGTGFNASQAAPPVINTTGFNSLRALDFASSKYLQIDSLAASFADANTRFTLVMAANFNLATGFPSPFGVSSNSVADTYVQNYVGSSTVHLLLNPDGSAVLDTTQVTSGKSNIPIIYGLSRDNGIYSFRILDSGGFTNYAQDAALVKSGALTAHRAALGAMPTPGASSGYADFFNGKIRALGLWFPSSDMTSANLGNLMTHFRDRLGCAV